MSRMLLAYDAQCGCLLSAVLDADRYPVSAAEFRGEYEGAGHFVVEEERDRVGAEPCQQHDGKHYIPGQL
jgi:hypothetical protein